MKTIQKLTVLLFAFCAMVANSQTYNSPSSELEGFHGEAAEMSFLSSQNPQTVRSATRSYNEVFINQIGSGNNAVVNTKSNSTDLDVTQNGVNNDLYYQVSANTIKGSILQNGDNNSIFHTNPFDIESHEAQILQNGNNQSIEWAGDNSLSEKMKINMQGESNQSIIIRSFN